MAEKDTQYKGKLKHKGVFDFKDFYKFTYNWLSEEEYTVAEKKYSEEITGDSKLVEIEWEAKKKVSDYFRFVLKIAWRVLGLKDVEVVREGKKEKINSGTVEIKISALEIHKRSL